MLPKPDELAEAKRRIAELERKIGQQQVDLDFFRQALRQVRVKRRPSDGPGAMPSTPTDWSRVRTETGVQCRHRRVDASTILDVEFSVCGTRRCSGGLLNPGAGQNPRCPTSHVVIVRYLWATE